MYLLYCERLHHFNYNAYNSPETVLYLLQLFKLVPE